MMPRSLSMSSVRAVCSRQRMAESEPKGTELYQMLFEETIKAPDSYQCNDNCRYANHKEKLILGYGGATIKIIVGVRPNRTTFVIHKSVLMHHSEYFARALRDGNKGWFIEADIGEFDWPDDDPEEVHRWMRWLYSCRSCQASERYNAEHVCKKDSEFNKESYPWCHSDIEAEQAYMLGDRLLCPGYCLFALASIIQHVNKMDPHKLLWMNDNLPRGLSLYRFVHMWVDWQRAKPQNQKPEPDKEVIMQNPGSVRHHWVNEDPRYYSIHHWSERCWSWNSWVPCKHIYLQQALDYAAARGPRLGRKSVRRISPARKKVLRLCRFLWYGSSLTMLVLSAYIVARDRDKLIAHSSKALAVVTATFGLVGTCFSGNMLRLSTRITAMMSFAAAIYSSHQAARCFFAGQMVPVDISICKIQAGLASIEILYMFVVCGIIMAWGRWDRGYFGKLP